MFTRFIFTFKGKRYFEDHLTDSLLSFHLWYDNFIRWGYTDIVYFTIESKEVKNIQ